MAHTRINEWKVLGDGSVRAKVKGQGKEGAEHYILSFCYAVDRFCCDIMDDWGCEVNAVANESLIGLFQTVAEETKISFAKLADLMIVCEKNVTKE